MHFHSDSLMYKVQTYIIVYFIFLTKPQIVVIVSLMKINNGLSAK